MDAPVAARPPARTAPPLLRMFLTADWDSKGVRAVDWALAAGSIAVGLWLLAGDGNPAWAWIWLAGGVAGAWAAWRRPMTAFQRWALGRSKLKA